MARNPKVELRGHEGQVVHPITDGDCVIFPSGETLSHKLSEREEVMYAPEVTNSSPMFKVGEGDSADYSANVLDGAYQEAVLKGQTYVNTIQEPSADVITLPTPFTEYERTQSKTFTEMQDGTFGLNLVGQSYVNCIQEPSEPSYVALGENLEFQNKKVEYTTEGQIKSAMLKGQTLVNLITNPTSTQVIYAQGTGSKNITIYNNYKGAKFIFSNGINQCLSIQFGRMNTIVGNKYLLECDCYNGTSSSRNLFISNTGYANTGIESTAFTDTIQSKSSKHIKVVFTMLTDQLKFGHNLYTSNVDDEYFEFNNIRIIEYQEGMENWDIPYFQGMQSVTMATELENVCSRYNSSGAKNGKTFTVGTWENRILTLSDTSNILNYNFKQNTKYLMQFKISNLNLDGLNSIRLYFYSSTLSSGDCLFGEQATIDITKNGIYRAVFTTSNVINTSVFVIKGGAAQWENSNSTSRKLTISQIMCIEYQNGMENWDLPYFETTQLMKPLKVQSVNKNLASVNTFQLTTKTDNSTGSVTLNQVIEANIPLNPSLEYIFTSDNTHITALCTNEPIPHSAYQHGHNHCYMYAMETGGTQYNYYRNLVSGYKYITITTGGATNEYDVGQTVTFNNIQLEESSTATSFVPHQSKITSALEPITLRATGDAIDTLDLSTGEYVQRIGEIVLDGTEEWTPYPGYVGEGNSSFVATIPSLNNKHDDRVNSFISDKFISSSWFGYADNQSIETVWSNNPNQIGIRVKSEKASNVAAIKEFLSANNVKIQYELATPITRKISLEYPNLQTYQDITHVQPITMDGTLIPKIFLPSDISYKAMLKPNTSYNVIIDREVIDSTNQLTVNLGGTTANITANRTIVRTPSTLSSETLTFSGKDNRLAKAMLIEGSTLINGDLPHFDGIGDVKLGRVVENLCSSNEKYVGGGSASGTYYENKVELKMVTRGSSVVCFPLTKQLINGRKYFIYCPMSCSVSSAPLNITFTRLYNGVTSYALQPVVGNGKKSFIITMHEKFQLNPYTQIAVGCHSQLDVNTTMTIRRPILCEYIDGMENWDWESIGYFTGTRNIGNEFMRISNSDKTKHNSLHILPNEQIPLTFVQGSISYSTGGSWTDATNNTNTTRIRTQLLDLEPNETYRVSYGGNGYKYAIGFYNNSNMGSSVLTTTTMNEYYFTTTKDVHKIGIVVTTSNDGNITPSALHQVRLEKVTDVTLRSIGNVKDELDLTRGVYIQRIGEIVLNGLEQWSLCTSAYQPTDTNYLNYDLGVDNIKLSAPILCDTIKVRDWTIASIEINSRSISGHSTNRILRLCIEKTIAPDVESLKTYLSTNVAKVQYHLRTPIEHKVHIPMKNESNQTIVKPNGIFTLPLMHSGNNHIDINSQIYPKVQSRDYISYPVIANNRQIHTVFHNKLGTGNLTVNLCGTSVTSVDGTSKCTVTTPSTISQYELRLSGARNKVSNVCVFSGDHMNVNVPYVEGMMNAVNPIVKNIGKNLFSGELEVGTINSNNGSLIVTAAAIRCINYIKLKQNTLYTISKSKGTKAITILFYDKDKKFTRAGWDSTFILKNNEYYIKFTDGENDLTNNYQIEESSTPSQYEPYKENICEPYSEDIITLRSLPNGVRDELNLETGEYIQRIGEYILDGSVIRTTTVKNGIRFYYIYLDDCIGENWSDKAIICKDKNIGALGSLYPSDTWKDNTIVSIGSYFMGGKHGIGLFSSIDSSYISTYLRENPITVQYELETPIVKQIDINNFPHSYKDGHVIIESNDPSTNVSAQLTYQCVANRTGQIQEHTEQIEKQEHEINELEMLILENIRQQQNR